MFQNPRSLESVNPKVIVVLLNWNQTELTLDCLRSLGEQDYPDLHTIVVDNGSRPDTLTPIESAFPQVALIRNERNLGFTGGNNVGIRWALMQDADYIMLLNNDTELAPDAVRLLVEFAESGPEIGIVGPLIYYYDAPERIWFAGGRMESASAGAVSLGEGELDDGTRTPMRVDWISGCALMIKRRIVEQVGVLDERMFIYYEEADWCARVREAGYAIWLVPQAKVWHKISMQARSLSRRYIYLMTRNRLLYLRNRHASWPRVLWEMSASDLRQAVLWAIRPRYRDRRPVAGYKALGVFDFLRGRFGEPSFPP